MWNNLRSIDNVITIISHVVHYWFPTILDLEGDQGLAKFNKELYFTPLNGK